ncbi:MAG: hypothetical protein PHN57_06700 [Candidatus Omnitrophica bacterium]|nr:hypothetical protein [Candidatus Omnitrophota bacterium]
MKKIRNVMMSFLLAAVLSGCVAYGEAYIPAPPPPEVEVIGVAPYPGAIWVPGYWGWHRAHHRHEWHHGYWRR